MRKPPPQFDPVSPIGVALNKLSEWMWKNRILDGPGISYTGDGIRVFPRSDVASTTSYPFQAIPVPILDGDPPADPFAIAVDRGHIVNIDGVPFAPSNLRAPIVLDANEETVRVYLDLTLDPETGEILDGTIEATSDATIPVSPSGSSGTGLGPAKAYKQLFTISTSDTGASLGTVAEHSQSNFALIRYAKEALCDSTTWAMAFVKS